MLPEQIREVRSGCRASRRDFAIVTKIGEASLARWETGQLIQNGALDNYLYLLSFSENYERLQTRYDAPVRVTTTVHRIRPGEPVLRVIEGGSRIEVEATARRFSLHRG
jgi:hypothetical protein